MEQLTTIKKLIEQGDVEQAFRLIDHFLQTSSSNKDQAYYLQGNAHRKSGNWQQALNSYTRSIELNPDNPAREARRMVMDILNFFHKDMYNQ